MKTTSIIAGGMLLLCAGTNGWSQSQQSLSSTLNVYAFPSAGQSASQQSKDEGECYNWAVGSSGVDPFKQKQQQADAANQAEATRQQAASATQGSGARGALRGAAAGAIVGEIANDDAGKGAATGAAVGAVGGRMRARARQQQAEQQAAAASEQTQQASEAQIGNFRKAFSACLEAKKYLVKY